MNKNEYTKQFIFEVTEDIKKGEDIIVDLSFEEFGDSSGGIIFLEEIKEMFEDHFRDKSIVISIGLKSTKGVGYDMQDLI